MFDRTMLSNQSITSLVLSVVAFIVAIKLVVWLPLWLVVIAAVLVIAAVRRREIQAVFSQTSRFRPQ